MKVGADGKLYAGKKKTNHDKMVQYIETCLENNPKLVVSIHMDQETTYDDFVKTLAGVKKAGAQRVFVNNPAG